MCKLLYNTKSVRARPSTAGPELEPALAVLRLIGAMALAGVLVACGAGESRIRFGVHGDVETLRPLLEITATRGDWSLRLTGEEIGAGDSPTSSPELSTPGSGELTVEVILRRPGEAVLAEGAIELDIRDDWVWGVDVFLTNENPMRTCFGCLGHEAFAIPAGLTAEPDDSLFIVWGGNSISEPVVY